MSASMVVSGKQFNAAMEEINEAYAKQNARIAGLVDRVIELEKIVADTPAGKKAAKAKEVPVDEAALADIADR